jgi:hypothetical protein
MTRFPSLCRYRCGFLYDRQTIEPTAYKRSTMFSQILTRSHKLYGTAIASAAPEASLATNQWIVSRVRHSLGCFFLLAFTADSRSSQVRTHRHRQTSHFIGIANGWKSKCRFFRAQINFRVLRYITDTISRLRPIPMYR